MLRLSGRKRGDYFCLRYQLGGSRRGNLGKSPAGVSLHRILRTICSSPKIRKKRKDKEKALEPQSINYRFERVHSYWMVGFFLYLCNYSLRSRQKNDGKTRADQKSGDNQLKVGAKNEEGKKKKQKKEKRH